MSNADAIQKRRIFGIISHPDAGKTTLTEKLLLHGGAIREAGTVKARGKNKFANPTGWKLKNREGFLLPPPLCSLNMMIRLFPSWTLRGIMTLVRTPIVS